ncbi:ABC transporter permease [Alkalihalobacillus pseudalcaliphilus]|uniref:ABC transporter permease n=1 Tax=Alkalihalobacillus pseudalcaliphilus TaxID=79884 RepID=UPI00064DEF35|nr:ABC transporter permease subunit [Alkalihalobacillus pseudalcaliphilus]KMK75481.1 protein lplB [Alkalihalobacillus pseudalcaliphilus]
MAKISTTKNKGLDHIPVHRQSAFTRFFKQWDLQMFVLPGILLVLIFNYIPMYGIVMAFQNYNIFEGITGSTWAGTQHFERFFNDPRFWEIMRNTLVISSLKILIGFPAPIILALALNEVRNMAFKRSVQTITYLPHFLSWVIVAGFAMSLLSTDNGSINILLEKLNLIEHPINFLSIPEYFWTIIVTTNVWKSIGFASIVYIAAIAGVDPQLYEAAALDGASRFKQIYLITIPSIMPIIIIFFILEIGNLLNAGFEDLLLLGNNPILWSVGDVIDTYVYKVGISNGQYSYATAIGLFKAVISVTLLTAANYVARRSGNSLW